jgi:hypothetical protein
MQTQRTLRRVATAALLLVAFLFQGTWALAGTTGGIAGYVRDSNGAPVAQATVTATSPSQVATTTTDAQGHYLFLTLQPDTYTLSVTKSGIQPNSTPGEVVFADQTQEYNLSVSTLKTIASVKSAGASNLVKSGVGGDLYQVGASQIQASAAATGGGNLNTAYSAIATVPGLYVGAFGAGWNQAVSVRGANPFDTGYEYDGIPVNRAFDNYNSSTESNLGLQQLEVYTGGGPASISSNGTSGFINQVIKSGTYPGYATLNGGIATGAFYHQAGFEAGGATPDRNFSYYVGVNGYDQTYRYFDQSDGAAVTAPGQPFSGYGELFTSTDSGQGVWPICTSTGPGAGTPGCLVPLNGLAGELQQLTDRETVVNLHFGVPRKDGQKDDFQVLWSTSAERSVLDYNPSTGVGINNVTLANSQLPYQAGVNYPHYADSLVYNLPFGTPISTSASSVLAPQYYFQPGQPASSGFFGAIPTNYFGDLYNNDTGIVKLGWTHPFNERSYLKAYAYTFFSDWNEDGPTGGYSWAYGNQPVSPDYDLITHTTGGSLQYSNQLNDQNLLTFTGNYTTANVNRLNNEGFWDGADGFYTGFTAGGAACGGSAVLALGPKTCSALYGYNPPGCSTTGYCYTYQLPVLTSTPIGYFKQTGSGFTCYNPSNGAPEPCLPGGVPVGTNPATWWQSSAWVGPTGYGAGGNATWNTLWNGDNSGPFNAVKPEFTQLVLSDEFRPNDRFVIDGSLRYDNFNAVLAPSNNLADQFNAFQVANYACVNVKNNQVLVNPLVPGDTPPATPIYTAGDCDAAAKAAGLSNDTGWAHPNGKTQDGYTPQAFTNVSPNGYDQQYYSPRYSVTYTVNPDTVIRFSGGRYAQPPISASLQYLYSSGAAQSLWTNFIGSGYYSPNHDIPAQTSGQYDLSLEKHIRGTDWSFKLTPFYGTTSNWQQDSFIGTGFVTEVPVGLFKNEGVEFALNKGDFNRNGLAGSLAFTYTYAAVQYQNLGVPNQAATMNTEIQNFNALTKAGGGSPCYAPFAGTVKAAPCSNPTSIINPYYSMKPAGTIDPNGWYPASLYQLPPAFGPGYGVYAQSFSSPWTGTLVLNYRHDKLAITPSLQFQSGTKYGSPLDVAGVDPRVCGENQTAAKVPGANGQYCDYLTQAGVGDGGYLYIPNPQTGTFATLGAYTEPDILTGNIQVTYDVSPKVRLTLTGANLFHACFGGSIEPWTTAYPPSNYYCGYGTTGGLYTSNYYNGSSALDSKANPGAGEVPYLNQSYGPSSSNGANFTPFPFQLFVQAQIRL